MAQTSFTVGFSGMRLIAIPHENGEHYLIQVQTTKEEDTTCFTVGLHERGVRGLILAMQAWLGSRADRKPEE
jgi:hypothetical protein